MARAPGRSRHHCAKKGAGFAERRIVPDHWDMGDVGVMVSALRRNGRQKPRLLARHDSGRNPPTAREDALRTWKIPRRARISPGAVPSEGGRTQPIVGRSASGAAFSRRTRPAGRIRAPGACQEPRPAIGIAGGDHLAGHRRRTKPKLDRRGGSGGVFV